MSTTELKNYYAAIYRTLINERAIRAQIAYSLDRDRKVAAALVGVPSGPEAIKDELKARLITEEGGTDKTGAVQETLFHLPTVHENLAYFWIIRNQLVAQSCPIYGGKILHTHPDLQIPLDQALQLIQRLRRFQETANPSFQVTLSIICTKCGRTSYNPNDIDNLYCGYCHRFHQVYLSPNQEPTP